jgi:hypothetical protein
MSRRKHPLATGAYDRGLDQGARFGKVIAAWFEEDDAPTQREVAGRITAYLGRTYWPSEVRKIAKGGGGSFHLQPYMVEAYVRAFGKQDNPRERARAYRAAGVMPDEVSEEGLRLAILASQRGS